MTRLRIVVPKGHIFSNVARLLEEAGVRLDVRERGYRPVVSDPEVEVKIMKPQNIPRLLEIGSHDVGFTGHDWVAETGANVVELMDLGFDPVRLVAAIPESLNEADLHRRRFVVASEYENITRTFLDERGYDYLFVRTHGATEVFPPDDADMIVDNTATGRTLEEHELKIIAEIMRSSTRFIAHPAALEDSRKREKIEQLQMLFQAILDARRRVMLEMNVPPDRLEAIVAVLPCMRAPTVAPLYRDQGFAVKVAVRREQVAELIPRLKKMGATDILEYEFKKVVV
ncbi:MAG: ATP phosphoribosyltransferase [Calditrichaeota bacterium]|nr:MAG: ATP phosphoribosyltransferase [Calditrichota bacterium]